MYGFFAFLTGLGSIMQFVKPDPELPSPWIYLGIFAFCVSMMWINKYRSNKGRVLSIIYGTMFWVNLALVLALWDKGEVDPLTSILFIISIIGWVITVINQVIRKQEEDLHIKHDGVEIM